MEDSESLISLVKVMNDREIVNLHLDKNYSMKSENSISYKKDSREMSFNKFFGSDREDTEKVSEDNKKEKEIVEEEKKTFYAKF